MRAAYEVIIGKRYLLHQYSIVSYLALTEGVEVAVSGYCDGHYGIDGLYIGTYRWTQKVFVSNRGKLN